jgi:hypothetical protein
MRCLTFCRNPPISNRFARRQPAGHTARGATQLHTIARESSGRKKAKTTLMSVALQYEDRAERHRMTQLRGDAI